MRSWVKREVNNLPKKTKLESVEPNLCIQRTWVPVFTYLTVMPHCLHIQIDSYILLRSFQDRDSLHSPALPTVLNLRRGQEVGEVWAGIPGLLEVFRHLRGSERALLQHLVCHHHHLQGIGSAADGFKCVHFEAGKFLDPSSWGEVTPQTKAPLCQSQSYQAYAQCWGAANPAWFQSPVADSSAPSLSVPILEWTSGPPPVSGKVKSQGLIALLKHYSPQNSRADFRLSENNYHCTLLVSPIHFTHGYPPWVPPADITQASLPLA